MAGPSPDAVDDGSPPEGRGQATSLRRRLDIGMSLMSAAAQLFLLNETQQAPIPTWIRAFCICWSVITTLLAGRK